MTGSSDRGTPAGDAAPDARTDRTGSNGSMPGWIWSDGPSWGLFALTCGVLGVVFFAEFVFQPGRMLFGTDMLDQAYQLREFGVEELAAGRGLPLWNPFVYGGLPYLAVLPGPVFYPTSLLYLVLPLFRAIGWTFVLHMSLGGVLGFAAGRAFGLRRWSSAVVGAAFMFSGYVVSTLYGGHDGRMFAMVLIPGVFACAERGLETGRGEWFLGMGLLVTLQIFTPHTQLMYFSSLAVSAYAAFRLVLMGRDGGRESLGDVGRRAAWFAAGFVAAAAVGAVQLLPTTELLQHAVRGGGRGGYEFAASWAMPPQEISAFFLPDLVGSLPGLYWGENPFKLHTEYLGAATLALALTGWLAPRGDRRMWFLIGASVLGLGFSLGDATPVHRVAYELVPLIDRFRAPNMMLGPVSFFVALSAGFGLDRILAAREGPGGETDGAVGGLPWIWILVLSGPFLAMALLAALAPEGLARWTRNAWFPAGSTAPPEALFGTLRTTGAVVLLTWVGVLALGWGLARNRLPRAAVAAVLLLLVADLWRVDARYLDTVDPDEAFAAGPVVERMQEELDVGQRVWQLENTFGANELMHHDIPSVTGSQNFRLAWYDRLVGGVGQQELLQAPVLWPLLDLRFLTLRSSVESQLVRPVYRAGDVGLWEVVPDLPHAFFPDSVVRVTDPEEAASRTRSLSDPGALAVVEPMGEETTDLVGGRGTAEVLRWDPDRVEVDVQAQRGGLLFVSEIWHPDWRASVDGDPVTVHRVNGAFRGVVVPPGSHRVRWTYRSPTVRAGALVSIGSLVLVIGLIVGLPVRRRARDDGDGRTT